MSVAEPLAFPTPQDLHEWLRVHHATETVLWIRLYRKGSGIPSVDWNDCVLASLCWGWIDGQKKSLDALSFVQRFTPRRARSMWSKKNCEHAERLIAEGRMQPAGLAQVEAARRDGRWANAYAGSSDMVIPPEFLAALRQNPAASAFYDTLDRRNLFSIYHRLHTAKREETRQKRTGEIIEQLARGVRFH